MEKFIKYTELFERQTIELILAIDNLKKTIRSHDIKAYLGMCILLLLGFQLYHINILSNASENPLYLNAIAALLFFSMAYLIIVFVRILIFEITPNYRKYSLKTTIKVSELRKRHSFNTLKSSKIITMKSSIKKLRLHKDYAPVSFACEYKKLFKKVDPKVINSFIYHSFDVVDGRRRLKGKFNSFKTPKIQISKELYFEFYWVLQKMGRIENSLTEISEFIINVHGSDMSSPFYNVKAITLQKIPSNFDLDKKYNNKMSLLSFFNKNREFIK